MKLIIHCGLHKTATTSFQNLCSDNRSALFEVGILYPHYEGKSQHGYLMHNVQRADIRKFEDYLDEVYSEAKTACHTVLLSGEDFENCIVDVALATDIEAAARKSGFDSVSWVVVTRGQQELVRSLYSEMSKHGVTLRFDTLERGAVQRGCVYISTDFYNHVFVLDYERFEARFNRHTSGEKIVLNYQDFVHDFTGKALFERILTEEGLLEFRRLAKVSPGAMNTRLGEFQIEVNYLSTALGVGRIRRRRYWPILLPFVWLRRRRAKPMSASSGKR